MPSSAVRVTDLKTGRRQEHVRVPPSAARVTDPKTALKKQPSRTNSRSENLLGKKGLSYTQAEQQFFTVFSMIFQPCFQFGKWEGGSFFQLGFGTTTHMIRATSFFNHFVNNFFNHFFNTFC